MAETRRFGKLATLAFAAAALGALAIPTTPADAQIYLDQRSYAYARDLIGRVQKSLNRIRK